jgi:NTP pyrophosphatase (non-canonical NTP hydrolase)
MNNQVLRKALRVYGESNQIIKLGEEVGELLQAVSKYHWRSNNYDSPGEKSACRESVVTEVADVLIMLEQVKLMAVIDEEELSEEITRKVERLDDRLRVYED